MKKQIIYHQDKHIEYLFILSLKAKTYVKQVHVVYDVKNNNVIKDFLSHLEGKMIQVSRFEKKLSQWTKKHLKNDFVVVQSDYKSKTINSTKDIQRLTKEIEENYGGKYGNTNWVSIKRRNKRKKQEAKEL